MNVLQFVILFVVAIALEVAYPFHGFAQSSPSLRSQKSEVKSQKYNPINESRGLKSGGLYPVDFWSLSPKLRQNILSQFQPPQDLKPTRRTDDAASRGLKCRTSSQKLTLLIPQENNIGLTVAERPLLVAYLPGIEPGKTGELLLTNEDGSTTLFTTQFDVPSQPGVISFTLPDSVPPLAVGQRYQWQLRIMCEPDNFNADIISPVGWIERVPADPALSQKINRAIPQTHSTLYAEAGIWYDALSSLLAQRRNLPQDTTFAAAWESLLSSESVGLETVAEEPILDCCQPQ